LTLATSEWDFFYFKLDLTEILPSVG